MGQQNQHSLFTTGDNMIKNIDDYLVRTSPINHKFFVKIKSLSSAETADIIAYVKPIARDVGPKFYILHVGPNDLLHKKHLREYLLKY